MWRRRGHCDRCGGEGAPPLGTFSRCTHCTSTVNKLSAQHTSHTCMYKYTETLVSYVSCLRDSLGSAAPGLRTQTQQADEAGLQRGRHSEAAKRLKAGRWRTCFTGSVHSVALHEFSFLRIVGNVPPSSAFNPNQRKKGFYFSLRHLSTHADTFC